MESGQGETLTITISPSLRDAFDAALQTLQERRPSDQVDEIVAQSVISAARASGSDDEEDERWDRLFARSEERHARMAAAVRRDREAGRTQRLDPERL